jgi:hypothetical protein
MRVALLRLAAAVLILPAAVVAQGAPPRPAPQGGAPGVTAPPPPPRDRAPDTPPRTGNGVIRGRILRADTGAPIVRATVIISSSAIGDTRTIVTDERGAYQFTALPAGVYTVRAARIGFATRSYGQRPAGLSGNTPIDLLDGRTQTVDVSLPPGAAVEGKIVDAYGDPVAGASVQVMRRSMQDGQRVIGATGMVSLTDDLGRFRIYGLAAGTYYIGAAAAPPPAQGPPQGAGSLSASGTSVTYYPGTALDAEAQSITLAAGQEIPGIVVQLSPVKLASISGTVRSANGGQMRGGFITAKKRGSTTARPVPLRPDGSFAFSNLPPGEYVVSVRVNEPPEVASVRVALNGADVTLPVVTGRGALVQGRIVFEPSAPQGIDPGTMRLVLWPADGTSPDPQITQQSTNHDDWSFEISGGFGEAFLRPSPLASLGTWGLKAVTRRGVDVTDTPLNLANDIDDLEFVLTQKVTVVSGRVTAGNGAPRLNVVVTIFSEDPQKLAVPRTRHIASVRLTTTGQYTIRNLPPGRYFAIATDSIEPGEERDPEILETLRRKATPLTLVEGQTKALDLELAD